MAKIKITDDSGSLYDPALLQEMRDFITKRDRKLFESKVLRVYFKCLRTGHIKLAKAIHAKHNRVLSMMTSDRVIAAAWALHAMNEKNNK